MSTQGDFASRLAEKFGYGHMGDVAAVERLSSLSIRPGVAPDSQWEVDAPATDLFIAKVQASMQMILQKVAEELRVPAPPSLSLHIIELPDSPQRVVFEEPAEGRPAEESKMLPPEPVSPPTLETLLEKPKGE